MRKLFLTAGASLLSLWISGCDSIPFINGRDSSTANTPEASPSPKLEAPESPSSKTTDGSFPSPDVPQKSEISTDLIRSTDPNERTKSLKQEVQTNTTSQTQTSIPAIPDTKDPFSGLPTIPVPRQDSDQRGDSIFTQLPEISSQQVPNIPNLPETKSPSSWRSPGRTQPTKQVGDSSEVAQKQNSQQSSQTRRANQANQNLGSRQPSSQSNKTTQSSPQQKTSRSPQQKITQQPASSPQQKTSQQPASESNSNTSDTTVTAHPPGTTQSQTISSPPKPPKLPTSSTQQVPSLPELPITGSPPAQWRGPGFPPTPPPPPPPPTPPPPPPDTTIADGIEVSGVVQVGSQKQIIVKVPTEPTSRYVKIGQRLANGQVLVKRVDLKKGAEPVVVFEQSGVEISKEVGSKPITAEEQ